MTPLTVSAREGAINAAKWLLDNGANVDTGIGIHATPLITAAGAGHLEMVRLLASCGANMTASYTLKLRSEELEMNAIKRAEIEEYEDVVNLLRQLIGQN